ncbi:MAG: MGH1-like glycoside hydrolase domain-containing protein [Parachlamydiaceae bacterium]
MNEEYQRVNEKVEGSVPQWQKWGPYVSDRAWGTVREDYSWNGDAWGYFPFEKAASKVYRWGEDGIAGWCDRYQILLFAPAFWNGVDPILKERYFGVNSNEGNHGEDVKEYYFYLDGTPTHSYMKFLYKYPQREFPYRKLIEENQKKSTRDKEYELVDTGIFAENRYFDIFIEYAKASSEDICIKIEAFNRGPDEAMLHIIPHLWFRNTWSWQNQPLPEPIIVTEPAKDDLCLIADDSHKLSPENLMFDYHLGKRYFYSPSGGRPLFTDNEDFRVDKKYHKDAFHRTIVNQEAAVNPEEKGTKACIDYCFPKIPPGKSITLYFRLSDQKLELPLVEAENIILKRRKEADAFFSTVHPKGATEEEKMIQRQAIAGVLWSKQIYLFDVNLWLKGDNTSFPPPSSRWNIRNQHWRHLNSMRVMLMPDKWEYPWFASWDLAFHCLTIGLVDIEFAKEQLWLLLFDQFQHPNGQVPAFEWDFSDLNPPLQAFAAWQLYCMQRDRTGIEDRSFLKKCLAKLLMNFVWWVNKVDSAGNNVFEGGFLGLDNIAIVNRSEKLPGGVRIQQSDGTGWMGMYCLNLMRLALEVAKEDASYEPIATKFFQHFAVIGHAMKMRDNQEYELWNEKDGFFYDVLSYPDKTYKQFKIRSLVGIIPLYAVEILTQEEIDLLPHFKRDFEWFLSQRKDLTEACVTVVTSQNQKKYVLSLAKGDHLSRILKYVWSPNEFRSDYGLRSLSKFHEEHPFVFANWKLMYEPAESIEKIKGGNSNWRGPIWMPTTFLLIKSLRAYASVFKDELIECEGEDSVTFEEMADSFANRLISLFKENQKGKRPFWGDQFPYAQDVYWRDYLLFHEYFHGDNGGGLGATHQTGWTALVANLIDEKAELNQ